MNKRESCGVDIGNQEEGRKWQRQLKEGLNPLDRIVAIGQILYIVRSNLVHGSKAESGDDYDIIQESIQPLKVFLEEAIRLTQQINRNL